MTKPEKTIKERIEEAKESNKIKLEDFNVQRQIRQEAEKSERKDVMRILKGNKPLDDKDIKNVLIYIVNHINID